MAGERLTILMEGGAPWGFRLFGGEELPLVIAKLRKRSKAADSGLQEEDEVLTINGRSCDNMSHATAMGLIDSAGNSLELVVLRGTSGGVVAPPVQAPSQPVTQPLQPNAPQTKTPSPVPVPVAVPSPVQTIQQPPAQVTVQEGLASGIGGPSNVTVSRQQETFQAGDTTKNVTTETRTEQFGSTKVTKVTRQTESIQNAPSFQVSNVQTGSKGGVWTPGVGSQNEVGLDTESKENISPKPTSVPSFKVSKITTGQSSQPSPWQPTSGPLRPMQLQPQPMASDAPMQEGDKMPTKWTPPAHVGQADEGHLSDSSGPDGRSLDIKKLLREGSTSDEGASTPDSPTSWKKKKFYADSAFYDDPAGVFPTMEEQVKMARKVALSLTAPINLEARGHQMFMKRKQKAKKWTSQGKKKGGPEHEEEEEEQQEPFYQKDPWDQQDKTAKQSPPASFEIPEPPPLPDFPCALFKA